MYIFLGVSLFVLMLVLLLADKFTPFSAMMSSFKKGSFIKLVIGLFIAGVASISYGIYYNITYQPPFIDIEVADNEYTIFGNIGEIGYYSDNLVIKGQETELFIVSWLEQNLENNEFTVTYPSGKEEIWAPILLKKDRDYKFVREKHGIENIYQTSSYTFLESGEVKLSTEGDDKKSSFIIKVQP